jgi:hypothetical protein
MHKELNAVVYSKAFWRDLEHRNSSTCRTRSGADY